MKSTRTAPLRKINYRWAWMAGATAAAASPAVHAQTAQISLLNNNIDSLTGNNLSLSITTGNPFGTLGGTSHRRTAGGTVLCIMNAQLHGGTSLHAAAAYTPHARPGNAFTATINFGRRIQSGSFSFLSTKFRSQKSGPSHNKVFALVPVTLTDSNLPGTPANANALLEVESFNQSVTDETVALLAVFYQESGNASPALTVNVTNGTISGSYTNVGSSNNGMFTPAGVPEPSGMALLALGAGGILARRRRKAA